MRLNLTNGAVRSLKPTDAQTKVWDTKTRGFGIRISAHTKTWIVMYGPKRTLRKLGRYPDVSLAAARQEALVYLATKPEVVVSPKFEPTAQAFTLEAPGGTAQARSRSQPSHHAQPERIAKT